MLLDGLIFIVIGLVLFLFLTLKSDYINIFVIITDFVKIFNSKIDYIIFYLCPLFFSIGIVLLCDGIENIYSEIGVIVGIILSMLFAGLSILTAYDCSSIVNKNQKEKFRESLVQTISAIRFDILISIIILIIIILIKAKFFNFDFILKIKYISSILNIIVPIIVLYLFLVVLLVLLMIIKNMFNLIDANEYIEKK